MPSFITRVAVGTVLAIAISSPLFAQKKGIDSIEQLLEMMHIENYSTLSFLDEKGTPIGREEYLKQIGEGKAFGVSKNKHENGALDVTFRLTTKEQVARAQQAPSKVKPGEAFPEFHLKRLDGSAIDNQALKGKYTVVSFYFAECAPCITEVPELNAVAQRRKDINVLAVTYDPVDVSKKFVADHHLRWPVVAEARKLVDAAGVRAYPTLALLDPQGKVVEFVFSGAVLNGGGIDAWLDRKMAAAN